MIKISIVTLINNRYTFSMCVQRVFVEKRKGFDIEAQRLRSDLADFLGGSYPELTKLRGLRILNRYDASGLDKTQFIEAVQSIFSEVQSDLVFYVETVKECPPIEADDVSFAIEYLPGQYNQRADSAEQCVELITGMRPLIRSAVVYILTPGDIPISDVAIDAVKKYLINPVDSREASAALPQKLEESETISDDVPILTGFITTNNTELDSMAHRYGLAMSIEDLQFCRDWFSTIKRDPTLAELRVLDTYWSDHCRHTTFNTILDKIEVSEKSNVTLRNAFALYESARAEMYGDDAASHPRSLWDIATIGAKIIKKRGLANDVDVSKEINACTIKINAEFSDGSSERGSSEPWLLLFKNETHNHPTEIEPFGGAATCLGGAIRDPLSGRAFVHQAMRVTGGGDPRTPLSETMPGKLPQVKIAREAAAGYSSYGNQIGLPTGQVAEFYHKGFLAKRMELGAVIAAVPAVWVRREEPEPGDLVILVGGRTGRDGIGGATGSSKVHSGESVETAGAEVQKGNAVEERKLQRLFRNPQITRLIKRCNDFGAGGVSVAVGELAAGLDIDLDNVPKKYAGLDGVELAISESQERMAVVCSAIDANAFINFAGAENLDAVVIATVTANDGSASAALKMKWRGDIIVDLARTFLDTNGASRSARALIGSGEWGVGSRVHCSNINITSELYLNTSNNDPQSPIPDPRSLDFPHSSLLIPHSPLPTPHSLLQELSSLRSCSRRGLQERFDGSIGAGSVLFPWGGVEQGTPECGMAALLPSLEKQSITASIMCFGYDPDMMERNPYEGAKGSIREALAKFTCLGGDYRKARLSLQEYFQRPVSPESWGIPAAALLGALEAQLALEVPAIGGKDSMSGNFCDQANNIDIAVPSTLVAFAAGTAPVASIRSGVLSGKPGNIVIILSQITKENSDARVMHGESPRNGYCYEEGELALASVGAKQGEWEIFKANMSALSALNAMGFVRSAYPVAAGGIAASLALMAFGNNTGLETKLDAFNLVTRPYCQGSVLVEIDGTAFKENSKISEILKTAACWEVAAITIEQPIFHITGEEIPLATLRQAYESPLTTVYPQTVKLGMRDKKLKIRNEELGIRNWNLSSDNNVASEKASNSSTHAHNSSLLTPHSSYSSLHSSFITPHSSFPLVILPVFPGTNCEWDMEKAFREVGARTRLVVFKNRNSEDIAESKHELAKAINEGQILALSGGFSAGDEPDGSGKFIANVLRSPLIADAVNDLIENRDGLILGICNGFQALIKLGLVPYGSYYKPTPAMPTLTYNRIGRHVSRMVRTRVMANQSPWLALEQVGSIHMIPVSHGEGRIVINRDEGEALFKNGQVTFCYADREGQPTLNEPDNPNGSDFAIEGLCSPDGRILGKMGHSERCGEYVHINIPGNKRQNIFEAGVRYFC
jgi:phosphoribosylformylglycinamidine synthase